MTLLGIGLFNIYIALGLYASAHFSFLAFGVSWFFGWGVVLRLFYRALRVGFALLNDFLSKRKRLKDLQLTE